MRVMLTAVLALVILAGPVRAQAVGNDAQPLTPLQLQYEQERRQRMDDEKKYNETMRRTRTEEPSAKADPWRNMRSSGADAKR